MVHINQQSLAFPKLKPFALHLVLAVLGVTLTFYVAGAIYTRAMLPLYSGTLSAIQPRYEVQSLQITGSAIHLETVVHRQVVDEGGRVLRLKRIVPVSIAVSSVYIQPIILLSILATWPLAWRKKTKALLLAIPLLIVINLIDIPFVLAWEVEDAIAADMPGSTRIITFAGMEIATRVQDSQLLTYWYVFLQTGGRQFLGLFGALLCIGLFAMRTEKDS
ncbi:MAG: hypothetical protein WCN95_03255 [bacterium]